MFTQLERIANTIAEAGYDVQPYDEADIIKIGYLVEVQGYSVEQILEDTYMLDDTSIYYCNNFTELAEEFVDEGLFGDIPSHISSYIDYEAIGRDLQFDYDMYEVDDETYILRHD